MKNPYFIRLGFHSTSHRNSDVYPATYAAYQLTVSSIPQNQTSNSLEKFKSLGMITGIISGGQLVTHKFGFSL